MAHGGRIRGAIHYGLRTHREWWNTQHILATTAIGDAATVRGLKTGQRLTLLCASIITTSDARTESLARRGHRQRDAHAATEVALGTLALGCANALVTKPLGLDTMRAGTSLDAARAALIHAVASGDKRGLEEATLAHADAMRRRARRRRDEVRTVYATNVAARVALVEAQQGRQLLEGALVSVDDRRN